MITINKTTGCCAWRAQRGRQQGATLQRALCEACSASFVDAKPGDDLYVIAGHLNSGTGTEPDPAIATVFAPDYTQAESHFVRNLLGIDSNEDDAPDYTITGEGSVLSLLQ